MTKIRFSLSDYQAGLAAGLYAPPATLCPYYDVDPVLYKMHRTTDRRRGNLLKAIEELRKRTERSYFNKAYPLQARTLDYSARSFPAYSFILPEVMTEDWLAIVDWGKFQRDHVLHQPLCGYVVLKLLDGDNDKGPALWPNGETLAKTCASSIMLWEETAYIKEFLIGCGMRKDDPILNECEYAEKVWSIFFREAAYVAAVFHDLGYPWQYAERIQSNLDGMNTPAVRQNCSASQIIEMFGDRLVFHALQGYRIPNAAAPSTWNKKLEQITDIALSMTHGFPGALGFLHLNDCIRRYPDRPESPLRLLCIEWAAAAIMMHDMAKIYWGKGEPDSGTPEYPFLRLSFKKDPLSAIVTLADFIQDFERPNAVFGVCKRSRGKEVTLKFVPSCSSTELQIADSNLSIQYNMRNEESRAVKRISVLKEEDQYFNAQYGYLDMSSLGIDKVRLMAC